MATQIKKHSARAKKINTKVPVVEKTKETIKIKSKLKSKSEVVEKSEEKVKRFLEGMYLVENSVNEEGYLAMVGTLAKSGDIVEPYLVSVTTNKFSSFIDETITRKSESSTDKDIRKGSINEVGGRRTVEVRLL